MKIPEERLNEALRKNETKLQIIAESSQDYILMLDLDFKIQYVNRIELGFSEEDIIGVPLYNLLPKNQQPFVKIIYEEVVETEKAKTYETYLTTPDGIKRYFESTAAPIVDEGNIIGLIVNTREITGRKKTEEALRESEERFRLIAFVISDLIYEWDVKTDRLTWFGDIDGALGYKIGEVNHTVDAWINHVHPEDKERLTAVVEHHRETGDPIDIEYRICQKNGSVRFWMERGTTIMGDEGKPIKIIGTCTDITERKQVDDVLHLSDELLKQMPDAILLVDENTKILRWMGKAEKMFGYSAAETIGRHVSLIQKNSDDQIEIEKALDLTGEFYDEIICIKKDKTEIPVELIVKNIYNNNGERIAIISIYRDIAIRKKAEKAHLEYLTYQSNFIHMISHELRTPLTVIRGYAEFLGKNIEALDPVRTKQSIKAIIKNIDRLEALISDVRDLSLIEKELFSLNLEIFNFIDFLKEIISNYRIILKDQLAYIPHVSDVPIFVNGDMVRLQQVFDNIISNAIKFTSEEDRKIIISLEILRSDIRVRISDNGAGIDKNIIEAIFDQFTSFRTTYSVKGTGVGLYISKEIMADHGGNLYAESAGIGKGSSFYIDIPFIQTDNNPVS